MLNWTLLKQPLNWLIIWVVMFMGAILFHLVGQQLETPSAS